MEQNPNAISGRIDAIHKDTKGTFASSLVSMTDNSDVCHVIKSDQKMACISK